MSIAGKYNQITCKKYETDPDDKNGKKCRHYNKDGTCKLPDELMCIEWIKRNPTSQKALDQKEIELGVPTRVGAKDSENEKRPRIVISRNETARSDEPYVIPDSDIKELEDTGFTMVLSADEFDEEVFIVPSYTDEQESRIELTWRDLATITTMVSVFPGSRVIKVRKNRKV